MRNLLLLLCLLGCPPFVGLAQSAPLPEPGALKVYWVDTEGGGSTLIVTPAGESVLVDTGLPGERDAKRIFDVATNVAGLKRIDFLLITHYHIDHFGGAAPLSAMMPIGTLYDNGKFPGDWQRPKPEDPYWTTKCEARKVINPGDELPLKQRAGGDAVPFAIKCLAARKQLIDVPASAAANVQCDAGQKKREDHTDNANSVVLLISLGGFKFFDGGDLTWNVEKDLVCPTSRVGEVDVYQSNHHGLDVSNNPILVRSLAPTVAIFNNGPTKGCEPESFTTVKDTPSVKAIYQLHRNMRADGALINTSAERIANQGPDNDPSDAANIIMLTVKPDGKHYTFSIPAKKLEETYETRKR